MDTLSFALAFCSVSVLKTCENRRAPSCLVPRRKIVNFRCIRNKYREQFSVHMVRLFLSSFFSLLKDRSFL